MRRMCLSVFILLMLIILPGCWDNMDINDRSFASAIGLDRREDGKVAVSLQVVRPNIIRASQEGGGTESAMWVSTTTGETVFDAIREQLKTIHRKPFYTHMRILFIGEDLAREGIGDVLDFFIRDHEVRVTPKVIITKGIKAEEIISADSKLENIPALHLEGVLENNVSEAKTRDVSIIDVIHDLSSAHGGCVIASILPPENPEEMLIKNLKMEGAAVFKKDRMVGYLGPFQTRGYLFLKDEVEGGIITIQNPLEKGKKLAMEIISAKGKMDVDMHGGEVLLKAEAEIQCGLGEQQGSADLANDEMLIEIEEQVEKEIERNIRGIMDVAQKQIQTDFIGFGNILYMKYPRYWEEIKDQWDDEFTKLSLDITIKAAVDRTGIIAKPIEIQ